MSGAAAAFVRALGECIDLPRADVDDGATEDEDLGWRNERILL